VNWLDAATWGLVATAALAIIMAAGQGMGITRISIPFILGTMLTPSRDRAGVLGLLCQIAIGWLFALGYALVFESLGAAGWWRGALLGGFHGLFVLMVALPTLPGLHPRMASATRGPEPTRALEPPGFLALNYGRRTPIVTLLAHVVYGTILGAFYIP